MAINPINKGKRGEKEFCGWLKVNMGLDIEPERNYNQAKRGSADIISVAGWCIEVKRREALALDDWWWQVAVSAQKNGGEPVVAFRQNRKPWEFLVSAGAIGLDKGYIRLTEDVFKRYLSLALKGHNIRSDNEYRDSC